MPPTDHVSRAAIVLANGDVPSRAALDAAWPGWDSGVELVVAADGGARHAAGLGLTVDRWVGDGDSLPADEISRLASAGVDVHRVAADKDESDAELAVLAAVEAGAESIVVLGGLGGPRLDHALANVGLLAHPAIGDRDARLYDEHGARISLLSAPGRDGGPVTRELRGRPGDLVSLLPIHGSAEGVRTDGLRYPLRDEPLPPGPARGLSNERLVPVARVSLRSGRLLVIETPANLGA